VSTAAGHARQERRDLDRRILALAAPALGALAVEPLVSLIDTAFVGRLGTTELAGLGVNTALFGFAFFVFNFLAYATTPLIAADVGRGDQTAAGRTAVQAVALAVGIGLVGLVVLQLSAELLLELMGAEGAVVDAGTGYLRTRAIGMPGVLLVTVGHGVFRGVQDTRTPLLVTLAVSVINLILDPVLIWGVGLGLSGAGLASAIGQLLGGVAVLWLLTAGRTGLPLDWRVPTLTEFRPFLAAGSALTVRTLALVSTFTVGTSMATRLGPSSIAGHQVASQVWLFLALVVDAIAIAAQAMVGKALGEDDRPTARAAANRMLVWGLVWGVALGVVFWLLRNALPTWFTPEADVVAVAVTLMPFVALMQPLNALVFVWDGVFIGAARFRFLAISMVGAAVLTIALLVRATTVTQIWWAITFLMVARVVPMALAYRRRL
jgi:MATE family multidrug resistance protein